MRMRLTLTQGDPLKAGNAKINMKRRWPDSNSLPLSRSISGESFDDDYEHTRRRAIQRWNRSRRDYRNWPAEDTMASPKPSFPFLQLPFEIRRMVYLLIVKRENLVFQMQPHDCGIHPHGPIDLRVALSSKFLFAEVMRAFFEENTIEVNIHPNRTIGLPILFRPEILSSGYWPLESIKRISLFIAYNQTEQSSFVSSELRKLCHVIQHCSLAKLQVTAYCERYVFSETLNDSFDHILAGLELIRNVRELVFTEDFRTYWKRGLVNPSSHKLGTESCRKRLQGIVTKGRKDTTD